ncbi:MAG: tRNA dihydrouridine synthase [Promethearchaeota archaeon]
MECKSFLAPMMRLTSNPGFLYLCKKHGCDVLVSPMIFVEGITHNSSLVSEKLDVFFDSGMDFSFKPFIVQIVGQDVEGVQGALDQLASYDIDGVNLNLGCPSHKMVRFNAGACMHNSPELRDSMIDELLKFSPVPVSIKTRLLGGKEPDISKTLEFCSSLEGNGIEWLAIHGRTMKQGYSGVARWDIIKQVNEQVNLYIVGNGDLVNAAQGLQRVKDGYCSSFMIGRSALKDPRVFNPEHDGVDGRKELDDVVSLYNDYITFLESHDSIGMGHFTGASQHVEWLVRFSRGMRNGRAFRTGLLRQVKDANQFSRFMETFKKEYP